jgi:ubiquinone/menaquinone biosynthesis C-methylase UbiE
MIQQPIRFDDGAAYERMMGAWSQLVGSVFLDWLSPVKGQRWIDVGCGNGAFTEQLIQRCAPVEAQGIDPSEAQLAFARTRPGAAGAVFLQGDAMVLPFEADRFDAAVMALVIHFVPDPAKGVGEMTRVVRPGGLVAAYVWTRSAAEIPWSRSAPKCAPWASRQRLRPASTLPPWRRCTACGRMRDWRGSRPARSRCDAASTVPTISGK